MQLWIKTKGYNNRIFNGIGKGTIKKGEKFGWDTLGSVELVL